MTHDNTAAVMGKFKGLGVPQDQEPRAARLHPGPQHPGPGRGQPGQVPGHRRVRRTPTASTAYPAGRGIGHQIMIEEGYVKPGGFCVASDSHSNIYGGLGALGTPGGAHRRGRPVGHRHGVVADSAHDQGRT